MICCLNPDCPVPVNSDGDEACRSCGQPLVLSLRNRYRPIKPLGQGGFGKTYLAEDLDRLNTRCVIKQFVHHSGHKSFEKALELFNQEAVRLNELGEHPQIPSLLAYFEHDGNFYLVQQEIDGPTLMHLLKQRGVFDEAKIRWLLGALLPVLQFVHDRSVVHRDINPTNIIFRRLDSLPVLIDFGIAKQLQVSLAEKEEHSGTRIGTEGYSPMEQLRSGEAYPASDLYSLGATCICLLTGRKPDSLYNPLEGKWQWQKHLAAEGRSVSQPLADILNRLLKDFISERYQSASEVLRDLQALPDNQRSVPGWTRQQPNSQSPIGNAIISGQSLFERSVDEHPPTIPPNPSLPPKSGPISIPPISGPKSDAQKPSGPTSKPSGSPRPSSSGTSGPTKFQFSAIRSGSSSRWSCLHTLARHSSWVSAVAFNPQLRLLASGGLDDTIHLWDLKTGRLMRSLKGHSKGINDLSFHPRGQLLVSCSDDNTIRIWQITTGQTVHVMRGHHHDITSLAVGRRGQLLISGSEDRTLGVWNLDQGSFTKWLSGNAGMIRCVAITPDEKRVVSGGFDNKIRVWDLASGKVERLLQGHLNSVNDLAISTDGRLLASAGKDRCVKLWSLQSGNLLHNLRGHTREVNAIAIHPDRQSVVSASSDGSIKIWNTKTGEEQATCTDHGSSVTAIAIHPDGSYMASASSDKTIKLWQKQ